MQVVAAGVSDPGVDTLDVGFRLFPVVAELGLSTHRLLCFAQSNFVPFEAVERGKMIFVVELRQWSVEGGESTHTHVDAYCIALRDGLRRFPLGLDRHEPLAAGQADGDVLHRTDYFPAVAVAQPTELGQERAPVVLIEFDLLRVGIAEAVGLAFLLEAREVRTLGEEVGVCPLQVLERLLLRVYRPLGQPGSSAPRGLRRTVAPGREFLAEPGVAELLLALLVAFLLQGKSLVEHDPARASEAAHLALLVAGRHQFVFEGLKTFHALKYSLVYEQ